MFSSNQWQNRLRIGRHSTLGSVIISMAGGVNMPCKLNDFEVRCHFQNTFIFLLYQREPPPYTQNTSLRSLKWVNYTKLWWILVFSTHSLSSCPLHLISLFTRSLFFPCLIFHILSLRIFPAIGVWGGCLPLKSDPYLLTVTGNQGDRSQS